MVHAADPNKDRIGLSYVYRGDQQRNQRIKKKFPETKIKTLVTAGVSEA